MIPQSWFLKLFHLCFIVTPHIWYFDFWCFLCVCSAGWSLWSWQLAQPAEEGQGLHCPGFPAHLAEDLGVYHQVAKLGGLEKIVIIINVTLDWPVEMLASRSLTSSLLSTRLSHNRQNNQNHCQESRNRWSGVHWGANWWWRLLSKLPIYREERN